MIKRYQDIIAGSFFLIVSIVMFVTTFTFKRLTLTKIGSSFMPQLIFGLLALLSIFVIYGGWKSLRVDKTLENKKTDQNEQQIQNIPVVATFAAFAIYAALLEKVGFLIMTAVYLFVQFCILAGKKQSKYPMFAIIAILSSVIIYYTFRFVFELMLPAGILG